MKQIFFLLLLLSLFAPLQLTGQSYQQLLLNPELTAHARIQPSHLAPLQEGVIKVGVDAGTRYGSTALPYGWLNQSDSFLDETEKADWVNSFNGKEYVWTDASIQAQVQTNFRGHRFSIGYAQGVDLRVSVPGRDLVELGLYGNVPFQNQTKGGSDLAFQNVRTQELQLAYAKPFGDREQVRVGAGIGIIQGMSAQIIDVNTLSLYTGPDADSVFLRAQYNEFQGSSGWGVSAVLGLDWQINDLLSVEAAVSNLGTINWKGSSRSVNASFGTSGLVGGPLFQDIFPLSDSLFRLDTLNDLFLPGLTEGTQAQALLPRGYVGMGFHQGPVRIFGAFHLQQWMGGEYLPSGSLSAMYGISKSSDSSVDVASFGLNVSSSRWQAFGFGAMAKGVISIGENQFVTLYLMADHLQGLVTPDTGRALSVRGGLLYVIW